MKILATIGQSNPAINYTDRPTVKVIIKDGDRVLILNEGLLPGGGVEIGESYKDAIARELQEELGVTVKDIKEIGTVIQYRNFLSKKYIVNGYIAVLESTGGTTSPQDKGETNFTESWLTVDEAMELLEESVKKANSRPMDNDTNQGKLFNLMSSFELLKALAPPTHHHLQLATQPFEAIRSGEKTIESRLFDEKRQLIQPGDKIVFTNRENPAQTITVRVVRLLKFKTFHDLFSGTDPEKFGGESVEWLENQINEFYSIEEQRRYGVVGIDFEVL